MSEQGNDVSGQQAAQPVTVSDKGAQPAGSTLSPEVIQTLVKQTVKDALSEHERQQQSQRDKLEKRIQKRIDDYKAAIKAANQDVEFTPDITRQLRSQVEQEIANESQEMQTEDASPAPAAQPAKGQEQPPSAIELMILKKFQKAGLQIEDNDPELADIIKADPTDLDEFKEKLDAAIEKKRARLQKSTSTLTPETAAGRVSAAAGSSGAAGNPIANITDPTELLRMGLSKKK